MLDLILAYTHALGYQMFAFVFSLILPPVGVGGDVDGLRAFDDAFDPFFGRKITLWTSSFLVTKTEVFEMHCGCCMTNNINDLPMHVYRHIFLNNAI